MCSVNKEMEESDVTCSVNKQMRHGTWTVENWFNDHLRKVIGFLPGPKTLFLDRYYFHPRVCVCLCVCLWVSLYLDYLKKFLTDFDETWQDD